MAHSPGCDLITDDGADDSITLIILIDVGWA